LICLKDCNYSAPCVAIGFPPLQRGDRGDLTGATNDTELPTESNPPESPFAKGDSWT
jgi:hypothetical protein